MAVSEGENAVTARGMPRHEYAEHRIIVIRDTTDPEVTIYAQV